MNEKQTQEHMQRMLDFALKKREEINCPQCGEQLIFPRDSKAYCEECGWPDEDFDDPH